MTTMTDDNLLRVPGRRHCPWGIALCFVAVSFLADTSVAQVETRDDGSAATAASSEPPAQDARARRAEIAEQRAAVDAAIMAARADGRNAPPALQTQADRLGQIDTILAQQMIEIERGAELAHQLSDQEETLERLRLTGPAEQRPYSFLLLERLRDERLAVVAARDAIALSLKTAEENLGRAAEHLGEMERARRQAKEALTANNDDAKTPELVAVDRLATLQSKFAGEQHELRAIEARNQRIAGTTQELTEQFLAEKTTLLAREVRFTRRDLTALSVEIDAQTDDLKRSLAATEMNVAYLERKWLDAKERTDQAATPGDALNEEVKAWRTARAAAQSEVALMTKRLERLAKMKQSWQRRYVLSSDTPTSEQRAAWIHDAQDTLDALAGERQLQTSRLADLQKDLSTTAGKLASSEALDAPTRRALEAQRRSLQQSTATYQAYLASVQAQRNLDHKLLAELQAGSTSLGDRAAKVWDAVVRVWRFEIAQVDDRPITVSKIVLGVLLLVVGIRVSRALSGVLGRRILPHVGVDSASSIAFQRVFFYLLLLLFTLLALNLVSVPLTVFTVLGGAIAIGVGFGAQSIINNFISGWILLAERQVNIGDLIEVEGSVGHVRSIGARCTHVRRPDGIDLLIPNSLMLERTVVNWTLTDAHIRTTVRVGVAYGSPTEEVIELIRATVTEHEKVLPHPEPIIIFEDFGDNALIFEVYFWVHTIKEMELRLVRSDIRATIDRLFRAAGIVIAFPQRDLHLDPTTPLDVRMLPPPSDNDRATTVRRDDHCDVDMLRRVSLFKSLTADELAQLAQAAKRRECTRGEEIVKQEEPGASLFVVSQGLLRVSVRNGGAARRLGQVLPGQFFGEMCLMTGETRTATVTAAMDSVVYEIDNEMIAPLLQDRPEVVRTLSEILARRRAELDKSSMHHESTASPPPRATELRRRIYAFLRLSDRRDA